MVSTNIDLKLLGVSLNIPEFTEAIKSLNSRIIVEMSSFYTENLTTVFEMLALQINLMSATVSIMQFEYNRIYLLLKGGYTLEQAQDFKNLNPQIKKNIDSRAKEALQNSSIELGSEDGPPKRLVRIINEVTNKDEFQRPFQALYYSVLTLTWMSFESLFADLWEALVNAKPEAHGQFAFKAEVSESGKQRGEIASNQPLGLSNKQIEFWLLEKYNFDLTNQMGTILKDKFDFTGIAGIRNAYGVIFPKQKDRINKILENTELSILEYSRNLIAHRGGRVDEKYKRNTNSSASVGHLLEVDGESLSKLVNASIDCATNLLTLIDSVILHEQKIN